MNRPTEDTINGVRERVVVAVTGGPESETLLRRGARIVARSSGGELIAVHVSDHDHGDARAETSVHHRALVESLGGSYHQVLGTDVPAALLDFARSVNATQMVIGVSRRNRILTAVSRAGVGATVVHNSNDIDVHIVDHPAAGNRFTLPRPSGALTTRRRVGGFVLALLGGPLVTWVLASRRSDESITSDVLTFQLLVVLVALIGGIWPALFAAVLSGLTLNYVFVDPVYDITIADPHHLFALILYVVIAVLVSYVVDQAARRSRAAARSAAESDLLATIAGSVIRGQSALQAIVSRTREAFGMTGVRLVSASDGTDVLFADGEPTPDDSHTPIPVGNRAVLEVHGRPLAASDRKLLAVIAAQIDAALEHDDLSETAKEVGPLTETDRVRSALLSAVGHDLRRPLAAATAAVSGLRSAGVTWAEGDQEELLATADESLGTLAVLVTNLLDITRLEAGVLAVSLVAVEADEVILPALDELNLGPDDVELDLAPDLPPILADPGLLQRVAVNLLANAIRFTPPGTRVRVSNGTVGGMAELRISDSGPGVTADRREEMFVPFQRLGDTDNLTGLGLGLALSKGFTEGMGGTLRAEDTPGGGLTMVVSLPIASAAAGRPNGGDE
jgi:two-component system sensor histidine kinase KdpD